jgi:hypothetical protein
MTFTSIMITDGGPHSFEKWASETVGQIIQIGKDASGKDAMEARKLELKLLDLLEGHHKVVQESERDKLTNTVGHERLNHPLDPNEHDLDAKVAEIVEVSKGSVYESHFAKPEIQEYIKSVLASHFSTSMHIERNWHADRNPDNEHAKLFKSNNVR